MEADERIIDQEAWSDIAPNSDVYGRLICPVCGKDRFVPSFKVYDSKLYETLECEGCKRSWNYSNLILVPLYDNQYH